MKIVFEPVDEKQLEIIFSSLEEITGYKYLGCALDSNSRRRSSPDALYLDKNEKKLKLCEFKLSLSSTKNFLQQCSDPKNPVQFDVVIALNWGVANENIRNEIKDYLERVHSCKEIILLSALQGVNVNKYTSENIDKLLLDDTSYDYMGRLTFLLKKTPHIATIYAAHILATHVGKFCARKDLDKYLKDKFPYLNDVASYSIQNIVQALYPTSASRKDIQNPVLSQRTAGTTYVQWNERFDSKQSQKIISEVYNIARRPKKEVAERGPDELPMTDSLDFFTRGTF